MDFDPEYVEEKLRALGDQDKYYKAIVDLCLQKCVGEDHDWNAVDWVEMGVDLDKIFEVITEFHKQYFMDSTKHLKTVILPPDLKNDIFDRVMQQDEPSHSDPEPMANGDSQRKTLGTAYQLQGESAGKMKMEVEHERPTDKVSGIASTSSLPTMTAPPTAPATIAAHTMDPSAPPIASTSAATVADSVNSPQTAISHGNVSPRPNANPDPSTDFRNLKMTPKASKRGKPEENAVGIERSFQRVSSPGRCPPPASAAERLAAPEQPAPHNAGEEERKNGPSCAAPRGFDLNASPISHCESPAVLPNSPPRNGTVPSSNHDLPGVASARVPAGSSGASQVLLEKAANGSGASRRDSEDVVIALLPPYGGMFKDGRDKGTENEDAPMRQRKVPKRRDMAEIFQASAWKTIDGTGRTHAQPLKASNRKVSDDPPAMAVADPLKSTSGNDSAAPSPPVAAATVSTAEETQAAAIPETSSVHTSVKRKAYTLDPSTSSDADGVGARPSRRPPNGAGTDRRASGTGPQAGRVDKGKAKEMSSSNGGEGSARQTRAKAGPSSAVPQRQEDVDAEEEEEEETDGEEGGNGDVGPAVKRENGHPGASSSHNKAWTKRERCQALRLDNGREAILLDEDITNGRENIAIECVNEYMDKFNPALPEWELPPYFTYIRESMPYTGGGAIGKAALEGLTPEEALKHCERSLHSIHIDRSIERMTPFKCNCRGGNCLISDGNCNCTAEMYGEHAYDKEGRLLDIMDRKRSKQKKATFITECFYLCKCDVDTCGNRIVQRGIKFQLQVFMTPQGKGWGIRTLELIPKGHFVFEYCGEILTNEEQDQRNKEYKREGHKKTFQVLLNGCHLVEGKCDRPDAWDGLSDNGLFTLDATRNGNIARFLNHCCEGNLMVKEVQIQSRDTNFYHIAYFARRDIKRGEELTWNYGTPDSDTYDETIPKFKCLCGSKKCQREI